MRLHARIALAAALVALTALPALAGDYDDALSGVKSFNVVFDFSHGAPKTANLLIHGADTVDDASEVTSMPNEAKVAVMFHGPAVHLLSTERGEFDDAAWAEVQKFQARLKDMSQQGVKLEVCQYALEVFSVDQSTVIPEIDQVPNGFVSVVGYQQQGYSLVRIP